MKGNEDAGALLGVREKCGVRGEPAVRCERV